MKTIASKLSEEDYQKVMEYCSKNTLTPSECIRRAIEILLAQQKSQKDVAKAQEERGNRFVTEEMLNKRTITLLFTLWNHFIEEHQDYTLIEKHLRCEQCNEPCKYQERMQGNICTWSGFVCEKCGWELPI